MASRTVGVKNGYRNTQFSLPVVIPINELYLLVVVYTRVTENDKYHISKRNELVILDLSYISN